MKKFTEYIFEKAPYWIVFFIGWIISTIFGFVIWTLLNYIGEHDLELLKIFHLNLFLGFFIGGIMFSLYVSMFRKQLLFSKYSKEVETLVENAKTKEELLLICENEFIKLKESSIDYYHTLKVKEIFAVMKTKYKYLD
jgi:hypothetical protein